MDHRIGTNAKFPTFFNHIISIWRFRSVLYQRVSSYVSSVASFLYCPVSFILTSVTFYRSQSYFCKWPLQHVTTIHVVRKSNLSIGLSSNWSVPLNMFWRRLVSCACRLWNCRPSPDLLFLTLYLMDVQAFTASRLSMSVCFGDTSVWPKHLSVKGRTVFLNQHKSLFIWIFGIVFNKMRCSNIWGWAEKSTCFSWSLFGVKGSGS